MSFIIVIYDAFYHQHLPLDDTNSRQKRLNNTCMIYTIRNVFSVKFM